MLVNTRGREEEWKKQKNIYAEIRNPSQLIYWISRALQALVYYHKRPNSKWFLKILVVQVLHNNSNPVTKSLVL